jgi:hypothetical protein
MNTGTWSALASGCAVIVTALIGGLVALKGQGQDRILQQDRLNLDAHISLAEEHRAEIARLRADAVQRRTYYEGELEDCRRREIALLARAERAEGAADELRKTFTTQVLAISRGERGVVDDTGAASMPASDDQPNEE